jgi:hypothetical protein
MSPNLLKKKFQVELEKWLKEEDINVASAAWLLCCTTATVNNWLTGRTLPGRNNGILLAYFSDGCREVLYRLVGLYEVEERLKLHRKSRRLVKAA